MYVEIKTKKMKTSSKLLFFIGGYLIFNLIMATKKILVVHGPNLNLLGDR